MFKPIGWFLVLAATIFCVLLIQFQLGVEPETASLQIENEIDPVSMQPDCEPGQRPADFDQSEFPNAIPLPIDGRLAESSRAIQDGNISPVANWEPVSDGNPDNGIPESGIPNAENYYASFQPGLSSSLEVASSIVQVRAKTGTEEYIWNRPFQSAPLLLVGNEVRVQPDPGASAFELVDSAQQVIPGNPDQPDSKFVAFAGLAESTLYSLNSGADPNKKLLLHLQTPSNSKTNFPIPKIDSGSSNPDNNFADENFSSNPIKVYGDSIKVLLSFAEDSDPNTELVQFSLFDDKTGFVETFRGRLLSLSRATGGRGLAVYKVTLPDQWLFRGNTGKLLAVYHQRDGEFSVSEPQAPLKLVVVTSGNSFFKLTPPAITEITDGSASLIKQSSNQILTNSTSIVISGTHGNADFNDDQAIVVGLADEQGNVRTQVANKKDQSWSSRFDNVSVGSHLVSAKAFLGSFQSDPSNTFSLSVNDKAPRLVGIDPPGKSLPLGPIKFRLLFSSSPKIDSETLKKENVTIPNATVQSAILIETDNAIEIVAHTSSPAGGTYSVEVSGLKDVFGNDIPKETVADIIQTGAVGIPSLSRGVPENNTPFVEYPEFLDPRERTQGFNPSDKVETRVTRLYYFRDAHRVAQIINRQTRSYNRQGVTQSQQAADQARGRAIDAQNQRQLTEQNAIVLAQELREAENRMRDLQSQMVGRADTFNSKLRELERLEAEQRSKGNLPDPELANRIRNLRASADQEREIVARLAESSQQAEEAVLNKRSQLNQSNELLLRHGQLEDRAKAEQFQLEVAAAHTDPDTFAAGDPNSQDPVAQVSISVIGEGLIQLRGPVKGVNIVRKMIHEIDSPVGQARISMHTIQINGDQGERMEEVANRIQKYVDHARFLTAQSSEMLRKSVTMVAARKAEECYAMAGAYSQQDRDRIYLTAFFGTEFIRELESMDSEFLKTGNKVLSLHSMDSTSLAHALFLMALAKNGTRMEILQAFEDQIASALPQSEQNFFEAGSGGCQTCRKNHFGKKQCDFVFLSQNARFESLKGLFDVEISGDDTLTPLQREFIRLAQIFKSQLVTEMEYKQRVRERAIIEERLGAPEDTEKMALKLEDEAREKARNLQEESQKQIAGIATLIGELSSEASTLAEKFNILADLERLTVGESQESMQGPSGLVRKINSDDISMLRSYLDTDPASTSNSIMAFDGSGAAPIGLKVKFNKESVSALQSMHYKLEQLRSNLEANISIVSFEGNELANTFNNKLELVVIGKLVNSEETDFNYNVVNAIMQAARAGEVLGLHVRQEILRFQNDSNDLYFRLTNVRDLSSLNDALALGVRLRSAIHERLKPTGTLGKRVLATVANAEVQSTTLAKSMIELDFAQRQAAELRRPLDHKKFLDMLIDDLEDKYVELLEGTRAQIANVDNYLKRVSTALETDFDVQYYRPAFSCIRQSSQSWDVELGQVETSTILANNRQFAKVSPQATFEFDLPKRDILINEAMNGAMATVDAYGALVTDPSFLALANMNSGQPTGSSFSGNGYSSPVRDVLPGLSTSTQEQRLIQSGPGNSQFNAAFDSLIPDPAIYKFETGTGYELRPVIQPDGQAVVYHLNYMYTTNVREPVRADEKHLGRVKRHFIDTDVQLSNYELREVSRYQVALKAARTARGVPLLEGIPVAGALFRPLPSQESALQQNIILSQATIFPTLFDLMGLRWAPAVSDLDSLRLASDEFTVRQRRRFLDNRVYDHASSQVDEFLRIPEASRRPDLYRSQETIPREHPNGYRGNGLDLIEAPLQETGPAMQVYPQNFVPAENPEGTRWRDYPNNDYRNYPSYEQPLGNYQQPGNFPNSHTYETGRFPTGNADTPGYYYENTGTPSAASGFAPPDPRQFGSPGNGVSQPAGNIPVYPSAPIREGR